MASSRVEFPIFADTNLGTRIALVISSQTTANDFKREFERAHLNCFQELGRIKVNSLMVKRKLHFYHLSESLPLIHAFQHLRGFWSLHVEACLHSICDQLGSSEYVDGHIRNHHYGDCNAISGSDKLNTSVTNTDYVKAGNRKKWKRVKKFPFLRYAVFDVLRTVDFSKIKKKRKRSTNLCKSKCLRELDVAQGVSSASCDLPISGCEGMGEKEQLPSTPVQSHCETLSEAVSVSGIIKKYFSSPDEVNSGSKFYLEGSQTKQWEQIRARTVHRDLNVEPALLSPFPSKTTPQISEVPRPNQCILKASRSKSMKIEIGNRLLSASKCYGLDARQEYFLSLSNLRAKRSLVSDSAASFIRSLVYEMSDEDD